MYNVLIVEDDAAMRFIYKKMKVWNECGFNIANQASNGRQALDIIKNENFDLIFSDVRMPFMDGIELIRELRKSGNQTNVIFSSSYDEFEYARQGLILGAFDYLLKPVDEKKLAEALTKVKEKIIADEPKEQLKPAVIELLKELGRSVDDNQFVHNIALYFSAHYGKTISIEEAAGIFGYSKDYFGKMFKQQIGITFPRFSSTVKIAYAKDLMRTGNYKTNQISDMLGYSSTDYFLKVFKEVTGVTPASYKASLEENSVKI